MAPDMQPEQVYYTFTPNSTIRYTEVQNTIVMICDVFKKLVEMILHVETGSLLSNIK